MFCHKKYQNQPFSNKYGIILLYCFPQNEFSRKMSYSLLCYAACLCVIYVFSTGHKEMHFRAHSLQEKEERIKSETLTYICRCSSKLMDKCWALLKLPMAITLSNENVYKTNKRI